MATKIKTLAIGAAVVVVVLIILPRLNEMEGNVVKLGAATLYDGQGQVIGTVEPGLLTGAFVGPDPGGDATSASIPLNWRVWFYDMDEEPAPPNCVVYLIRTNLPAGAFVPAPGEGVENYKTIVGSWTYEGTSRKAGGKDWLYEDSATFLLDADAIACDYDLQPGDKIAFAGYLEVKSSGLSARQRSSNAVTFQIAENYNGQLVIETLSVS